MSSDYEPDGKPAMLEPPPTEPLGSLAAASAECLQLGQPGGSEWRFAEVPATDTEPAGFRLKSLAEVQAEHVAFAIEFFGWNISRTALALDVDRRTMHRLLDKQGLRRPPHRVTLEVRPDPDTDPDAPGYTITAAEPPKLIAEDPGYLLRDVHT